MSHKHITLGMALLLISAFALFPDSALAQVIGGGSFESKMDGLTSKLLTTLLPIASILGLLYAAVLAIMGDGNAKSRMTVIIVCSLIGFMAPHIIGWLQAIVGG